MNDPAVIDEMLRTARTIAVVGMSDKTWRASRNIGQYLAAHGYRVVPVNPALNEVDDAIRLGIPYLWLQDEVRHEEAVARARAAGIKCVENDCIYRHHARAHGKV